MTWLVWTVVFIIVQVGFLQLFKYAARDTKNIGALTVTVQIIAALSMLVLVPFFKWQFPGDNAMETRENWLVWLLLGLSLVLFAIDDRMDATTRKNMDISTDTMLQQINRLFFFALGIIFLNRSFTVLKLVGGVLIVVANMLALFEKGKFKFNKYVWMKLLSTVFLAIALTLQVGVSDNFNLPFFCFLSFSVPAVLLLITRQATPKGIWEEVKRKDFWLILLCGICQGLQCLSLLRAYEFYDKFLEVASITGVYVIVNVFFAYVFLKERKGLLMKIFSAAIIVGSIIMITLG